MTIETIKDLVALGGYDCPSLLVAHLAAHGTLPSEEARATVCMRSLVRDAERLSDLTEYALEGLPADAC